MPIALPEAPSGEFFTELQWTVLFSLLDAILCPVVTRRSLTDKTRQLIISDELYAESWRNIRDSVAQPPTEELFAAFLAERPSDDPSFVANVKRTIASISDDAKKQYGSAMAFLATPLGAFMLTGQCVPVQQQPIYVREAIIRSWTTSWFVQMQLLAKTTLGIAKKAWSQTSPLLQHVSGYSDLPQAGKPASTEEFQFTFEQVPQAPTPALAPQEGDGSSAPTPESEPYVIETDAVVVGSGCGGGVCAKVLAEAGFRVLVVDKAYHIANSNFPLSQETACTYLFESGGFVASDDNSVTAVAGAAWGGGGTVNWSVSLRPQEFVRREWARDRGLAFFETPEFDACLDRVEGFMGVGPTNQIRHNHQNRVMLEGTARMGLTPRVAPQNTAGGEHYCGHCHLGCRSQEKQGPAVCWLPAAARSGAKFMEGFLVEKVLFEEIVNGMRRASGVVGTWTSRDARGGVDGPMDGRIQRRVVIKAKKVILSAGSLWSPLILLRSDIKNPHIGKNLYLHPCAFTAGYYKENEPPWEGGIITAYCSDLEDLDGKGHGVKLEPTCMMPYTSLTNFPWRGVLDYRLNAIKLRHMNVFIALTRERDPGDVYPDPISGRPRIRYTPSALDSSHSIMGIEAIARLLYVTGATEIHPFVPGVEPFVRDRKPMPKVVAASPATEILAGSSSRAAVEEVELQQREPKRSSESKDHVIINMPEPAVGVDGSDVDADADAVFAVWLKQLTEVATRTVPTAVMPWSSAHQMGTCRMSVEQTHGVVDMQGRVWGEDGLFVADASVFPSASGVNPMITNMAIADWIARGVAKELQHVTTTEAAAALFRNTASRSGEGSERV